MLREDEGDEIERGRSFSKGLSERAYERRIKMLEIFHLPYAVCFIISSLAFVTSSFFVLASPGFSACGSVATS